MNYEKIGNYIAKKRKDKNLTQVDLAKKIGVTDKAVSKWERGLGCPDVSILEVLAKELDVSILELLKGREIENEVINVTEADDYIKSSFKFSKESTKNKIFSMFSRIIFYLVSFVSMIFIILTVINYTQSKTGERLIIDNDYIISHNNELERLNKNIEKLKKNKGILTTEEQEVLINDLQKLHDYSEEYFVTKLGKTKKYSTNDIMLLYLEDIISDKYPTGITIDFMNIFNSHNMKNEYKARAILSNMYREGNSSRDFINHYKYKNQQYFNFQTSNSLIPILSYDYNGENELTYYCQMMLATTTDRIKVYNLFIEDILKAGGSHE